MSKSLSARPKNPSLKPAHLERLFQYCPCLFAQLARPVTAEGIVHLCEVSLGKKIVSSNVDLAFEVQHPNTKKFLHPPRRDRRSKGMGGAVMEALCAEVLTNHGIPAAKERDGGFPDWSAPCHVSLNRGKYKHMKLYGDFLIPTAPHNLFVSVKSERARERLILSGNRLETVGFGFFKQPQEFTSESRRRLFTRWGFSAIYMPESTLKSVRTRLGGHMPVNRNGRPLYRPLSRFGPDLRLVAGRDTLGL